MLSPSTVFNVRTKSNENFKLSLSILDGLEEPIDLSGISVKMAIKVKVTDSEFIFEDDSTNEDSSITISDSIIIIDIPISIVADWDFSTGVYDVVIVWAENDNETILEGKFILSPGVTE